MFSLDDRVVVRFYETCKGYGNENNKFHMLQNIKAIHHILASSDQFRSPMAKHFYGISLKRSKSGGDKPSKQSSNSHFLFISFSLIKIKITSFLTSFDVSVRT